MADVQIAVIDPEDTQLALAAPAEAVVNVAVPGVQGPIGLTGSVTIAQAGTAATPGIRFESDTNTGIYSPGADQVAISTNGTGRLFVGSDGSVGIGTSSPSALLELSGTGTVFKANTATTTSTAISLQLGGLVTSSNSGCFIKSHVNLSSTLNSQLSFEVNGGALEAARIDSSGRLLVGTSSAVTTLISAGLQVQSTGANAYTSIGRWDNNTANPGLIFNKSRGGSVGTLGIVQSGDSLGEITFTGDDGSAFVSAARIQAQVDGTPGTNDMPGSLAFSTTADGAASPTERLRITSAGVLQIADAGNITVGTTTGTKIGTATTQKIGFFNKTPVVQPTAVADATDAASAITQLNALLTRMRNLGLIAT